MSEKEYMFICLLFMCLQVYLNTYTVLYSMLLVEIVLGNNLGTKRWCQNLLIQIVQYSTIQYNTVQYSTIQYNK